MGDEPRSWIDEAVDRFEHAWRAGPRPRIEDFLVDAQEPLRPELLAELLRVEQRLRAAAGETLTEQAYRSRFPQYGALLDAVFRPAVVTPTPTPSSSSGLVGPYKLLQRIGEGGMGVVFMAEQEQPIRRRVAVKIIKPGMDTGQVIARFEAERQALALMDHPHIAKVLDAGATDTGLPYFVMELVKGVPITAYCDTNRLPLRERLELIVPVCQAIQHAHQKGVIHRDIKPSNVLVTLQDGQPVPKVIDFGVAKATHQQLTERTLFTQFGALIGTPEYMSPEQAEVSGLDVDTRSDVYSLGVLLYELLTGSLPLEKLRQAAYDEIVRRIKEEDPPKPSTRLTAAGAALVTIAQRRQTEPAKLPKLVCGELDWIVMKALEKDRTRRYETADGLARDVQRHLADEPVEACPPSATYRLVKLARKHRAALVTAAALLLAALAGLVALGAGTALVRIDGERVKADTARLQAVAAQRGEETQRRRAEDLAGKASDRAVRLDIAYGHQLMDDGDLSGALVWFADALGLSQGDPRRQDSNRRRLAAGLGLVPRLTRVWFHGGQVTDARFSPDGGRVVTATDDGTVKVWDTRSGTEICKVKHEARVNHAQFDPKSRRVVTTSDDKTARVWDAETGQPITPLLAHTRPVTSAAFSPDGSRVVTASADETARVWDAQTGQPIGQPLRHGDPIRHGYDTARDISRIVTALSTVPSSMAGMKIAFGKRDGFGAPTSVHLIGRFAIENFGGLDGRESTVPSWSLDSVGLRNHLSTAPFSGVLMRSPSPSPRMREIGGVASAAFSPDGRRVVTAGADGAARVWDAETGQPVGEPLRLPGPVTQATFSPDGRLIVAADQGLVGAPVDPRFGRSDGGENVVGVMKAWDAQTRDQVWESREHEGEINRFSFGPHGLLVTVSEDGTARVWDLTRRGGSRRGLIRHAGTVNDASCSPDGRYLATASSDQTVWVVDAFTGEPVTPPLKHGGRVVRAAFSPDGRWLLTAGDDQTARLWDLFPALVVNHPPEEARGVRDAAFSSDGRRLVLANGDATAWVCDALTGDRQLSPLRSADGVSRVWLAPDGRRLATAGGDQALQIWDLESGKPVARLENIEVADPSREPSFSPDGRSLVAVSKDGVARLWNANTAQAVADLGPAGLSFRAAFSPDGRRLATGGEEGRVKIWTLRDGRVERTLPEGFAQIRCLAFSPDCRRLLAAGDRQAATDAAVILVWEVDSDRPAAAFKHRVAVSGARFSADGRRVVTTGGNSAWVWDASSGEPLAEPLKHGDTIVHAEFSPDGLYVVTASKDRTARVWDASLGEPLTPSLWHPLPLTRAAFSADGEQILTINDGGGARVWDLAGDKLPREEASTHLVQLLGENQISPRNGRLIPLAATDFRAHWEELHRDLSAVSADARASGSAWHWLQAEDGAAAGRWGAVVWHLDRLLQEGATSTLWARRGDADRKLGEFDQALADYDRAGTLRPPDPALQWDRAAVSRERGDALLEEGIEARTRMASVRPDWREIAGRVARALGISSGDSTPVHLIGSPGPLAVWKAPSLDPHATAQIRDSYQEYRRRLEAFPLSHPLTLEGKRDLLISHWKLAQAQLRADQEAAGTALQECLVLLRELPGTNRPGPDALRDLADSFRDLGDRRLEKNPSAARQDYREALALWEGPQLAGDPNAPARQARYLLYSRLGRVNGILKEPAIARDCLLQALALAEERAKVPGDEASKRALADVYDALGDLSQGQGATKAADADYRLAVKVNEDRVAANPSSDAREALGYSYRKVGLVRMGQANQEGSREYCQKAVDLAEEWATAEPWNSRARRQSSLAYVTMGTLSERLGNFAAAREYCQKARQRSEAIVTVRPEDIQAHAEAAELYHEVGALSLRAGDWIGAIESYRLSVVSVRRMIESIHLARLPVPAKEPFGGLGGGL